MDDNKLIQEIRDFEADAPTLEPVELLAAAKRRRAGRWAVTGLASLAVAAIAITAFATGGGPSGSTANLSAAGGPDPIPVTVEPKPSAGSIKAEKSVTRIPPARKKWTPGGPIGARPIGEIPTRGEVQIASGVRFETKGTKWCISHWDDQAKEYFESFGCRGTVGNSNIGDGRSPGLQSAGGATSSVFRGVPRRVIYTQDDKYYEGKVYRLKGVPGWSLSFVELPAEMKGSTAFPDRAVFTYDENNRLLASFPESKADPLHQK
ncbi:hypothetical protein [Kribbella deserti]|uniref:Uncharacterized protein n=1 Tax=Kribbella deserti TaxID=1926257 RepID=A0ABV6QI14_9ACTN